MTRILNHIANSYLLRIFLLLVLGMNTVVVFAQDQKQKEGEVLEGEVIIDKSLKIELPPADRIFEKVPPRAADEGAVRQIEYKMRDFDVPLSDLPVRLRVLKLKEERLPVYSGNFVKLGIGNYLTPFLDVGLNSKANPSGYYGVHINHISSIYGPVDKQNSADSYSKIGFHGKYAGRKASIQGRLNYNRDMVHFYGYPEGTAVDSDTMRQVFNRVGLNFKIRGLNVDSKFQYEIDGGAVYVKDKFVSKETGGKISFLGTSEITENIGVGLKVDLLHWGYQYGDKESRTLIRVSPFATFSVGVFEMEAGVNVVYITDTIQYKTNTKLFPKVLIGYHINENVYAYAGLEGDIEAVSFDLLTGYNPYLKSGVQLVHTSKNLELSVGARGHILQDLSFDIGFKAGNYKNLYYFINDSLELNKFDVVYDGGNANVFHPYITLSYLRSNSFGLAASLHYYKYGTKDIDQPWHRPSFETSISGWFTIYKKIRISADLFVFTGMKALDYHTAPETIVTLDPITDLNLKVDYMFSKRYGAFVKLDNVLGRKYSHLLHYPVRGFQAMIGVSASF